RTNARITQLYCPQQAPRAYLSWRQVRRRSRANPFYIMGLTHSTAGATLAPAVLRLSVENTAGRTNYSGLSCAHGPGPVNLALDAAPHVHALPVGCPEHQPIRVQPVTDPVIRPFDPVEVGALSFPAQPRVQRGLVGLRGVWLRSPRAQ